MTQLSMVNTINFIGPPSGDTVSQSVSKFITEFNQEIYPILNNIRQGYIGPTSPANPESGMEWINTTSSPAIVNKRDSTNTTWVPIFPLQASQGTIPIGGIILWSGSIVSIPTNWHLCDGTNGTPNLQNQFVVGAGNSYAVGATGGESTHTLTITETPSHQHEQASGLVGTFGSGASITHGTYANTATSAADLTSSVGGGGAHNNLPPYYALAYIQRVS